jgi:phosphate/sulfate permease
MMQLFPSPPLPGFYHAAGHFFRADRRYLLESANRWFGIPSSSSHTLLGGFVGAALAHAGGWTVHGKNVIDYANVIPTFLFIVLAPLIGMIVALFITILIVNLFRRSNPYRAEKWFRRLQLLSSALLSLGHGGNDAQKVLGIIASAMVAHGDLGATKRMSAVRWGVTINLLRAWILTIPVSALLAAGVYKLLQLFL